MSSVRFIAYVAFFIGFQNFSSGKMVIDIELIHICG